MQKKNLSAKFLTTLRSVYHISHSVARISNCNADLKGRYTCGNRLQLNKEKLVAMWSYIQEQKFLLLQYFGICYSFVVITALYLINVSFTCPALYGWSGCTTPILIGSVIVANTVLNLVLFRLCSKRNRADVHYKGLKGPSSVASPLQLPVNNNNNNPTAVGLNFRPPSMPAMANSEGNYTKSQVVSLSLTSGPTKFCYTCQANFPSRVHHCSLCDYCVVRRDHHCFFTGGCVGFGNQRYFVGFLLWAAMGAAMGTIFAGLYLNSFYQRFWPFGWISYVFPYTLVKFLLISDSALTWTNFFVVLLFTVGYCSTWAALGFFIVQLFSIYKGKSLWESTQKLNISDGLTPSQRFKAIFGPYWVVNLLFPTPFVNKISYLKENYDISAKEM